MSTSLGECETSRQNVEVGLAVATGLADDEVPDNSDGPNFAECRSPSDGFGVTQRERVATRKAVDSLVPRRV